MGLFQETDWAYQTSDEESSSYGIVTGGNGHFFLSNAVSGDNMIINYNYAAVGSAKGSVWNVAASLTTDSSGQFCNVSTLCGFDFDANSFPCQGFIFFVGVSAGIFQLSFMNQSGLDLAVVVFGMLPPFAVVPIWGRFNSLMPTGGVSMAGASFSV